MKKAMVFLVLMMMLLGSCFVQNTNTAQKIVGTWTDVEGYKWIFTADGKLKYDDDWYKCVVTNTEMTIFEVSNVTSAGYDSYSDQSFKISFSPDGKTIKLTDGKNLRGWSVAGPGWGKNELTNNSSKSTNSSAKSANKVDKKLNGTWVGEDRIITFNNGKVEFSSKEGDTLVTETYTASNGKLNIDGEDEVNYSIKGKTLTIDLGDGDTLVFTRK